MSTRRRLKYLVTGGCGFIGSHLVDLLISDGHAVRVLDNLSSGKRELIPSSVELVVGDVADQPMVRRCMEGVDGCFHLAAVASVQRSVEDWVGTHRTNLTGTIAVFDAARARNGLPARPVVFASSAAVYGASNELPLAETSSTRPVSAYGADKLGSELHAEVAASVFNVPATGLRFFNVYGPRQDPESPYSGVVSIFSNRLRAGLPITIFGDGGQTRDFIFVGDVIRFLRAAMETSVPALRIFNVCSGRATSLLDLVATLGEIVARTPRILHEKPRSADIRHSLGDPAVARLSLGVAVQTTLRDGLRATLGLSGEPCQGLSESQLRARPSPA